MHHPDEGREERIDLDADGARLEGGLARPAGARGVVLFAHGSGSSRHSPRNRRVAAGLREAGLGTLLIDLLTAEEEVRDRVSAELRFDIGLLASRLVAAIDWLHADARTAGLAIGCFGASTGAGAALVAAAERPGLVKAVVSRGGRPDLAGSALPRVHCPTLLIVGARDVPVIEMNRSARGQMTGAPTHLEIVPGATHLFEEPGTLEIVESLARDWFLTHLVAAA